MNPSYRPVPETSDDQAVTKHFADKGFIRLAVIRAIRHCHYMRKRSRIEALIRKQPCLSGSLPNRPESAYLTDRAKK